MREKEAVLMGLFLVAVICGLAITFFVALPHWILQLW